MLTHQLETDIPEVEKLHIAAYAPRITTGWETQDKLIMLRYLEQVRGIEGGHSLAGYIEYFARDFFANLTLEERKELIAAGENYPTSALSVLAKLPENPGPEVLREIRELDKRLDGKTGEPAARLRVGIVAVLGRSGEDESLAYLRGLYIQHPERRAPVAMSLTQHPDGDDWPILVDSLRTVDGDAAREILAALARVDRQPDTSEPYRNAILLGLRLQANGGELAARLLEKWVGQKPYQTDAPLAEQLAAWQTWYATTFPNELPAELPKESTQNKWSYEELLSFLDSKEGKAGSPSRGAGVSRCAVHQLPPLQREGREDRTRFEHRRAAVHAKGSPGVDRLSESGRVGSIREPDRDGRRQDVHGHRCKKCRWRNDGAAIRRAKGRIGGRGYRGCAAEQAIGDAGRVG